MPMPHSIPSLTIAGNVPQEFDRILSADALSFVTKLCKTFEPRRQELLKMRVERQWAIDNGEMPNFLTSTQYIRNSEWTVAPLPADLQDRRVEITGPPERKMVINALNSGAKVYMADFEDSNSPTWLNNLQGHVNLYDAIRRTISFTNEAGKTYLLNERPATLMVRPRGWHLPEKHLLIDGIPASGSLIDFGLFFFHNAKELIARNSGPYFYLPKLESHLEARLWNDVFNFAQDELGIPRGTIRSTVLVETILAAFEMEEILYELKDHSAGLNAGRWDYIFSCIKKFKANKDFCLADRSRITMTVPFMRAYALLLLKTCHKRGASAMGGMAALIPIKNDTEANEKALAAVRADKERDANDGYDGGWVAHPGLVSLATEAWNEVMPSPNQIYKQRDDVNVTATDLLNFQPEGPITETGLRLNISIGIQYLGAWLNGNGCVPIHNLMEDAATAEISRSQVWQWIRSSKGILDDGRKVTAELVSRLIADELEKIQFSANEDPLKRTYIQAAKIFENLTMASEFVEFLTIPAYQNLD